ncbi:MAG TPA: tetratricopeptide repeat protein [Pyrinomonadaceae bacterium]|nr:tetratricopeptide repeat protein [Pyrinomonadaceae bacterium]
MRRMKFALSLIGAGLIGLGIVALIVGLRSKHPVKPNKTDQRILRAMRVVEKMPNSADGYNQLAAAYMQKARETADFDLNKNADDAITRSLAVEPDNYDALKLRAKLQLTYHRFSDALDTARKAQAVRTDDHDVWGQITDALVELGDYAGAVNAAQKMVDLRPDSSSYARVSYLRSLHGDTQGAIQAMVAAVKSANPNDAEAVAWCHVQLGNELITAGKSEAGEREFDEALRIFPDHPLALRAKAQARKEAGDVESAIKISEREGASADAAQMLGDLYTLQGRKDDALKQYEKFETLEGENAVRERSWRHMINYWLDHDRNLEQALTLASREYENRKDIFTCDSLAWALFKNGRIGDAKKLMAEALRTGTKDPRLTRHAGIIKQTP